MKRFLPLSLFLVIFHFQSRAQDSTIVIGIEEAPPFIHLAEGKAPTGLSLEFWGLVKNDARVKFEYKSFDKLTDLLAALGSKEIDMSINPITVTDLRMKDMDFSQPFFISGTAIVRHYESNWWAVVKNIFSWQFFSAVAVLLLVIFTFGLLIWHFEKKQNEEQFGKGLKGLADGFWWSAVTMTTVGYGDKAPVTRGGRIIGFIWMFAAIIMISSLTAGIASALTINSLDAKIRSAEDLRRFKVATIPGSSSADYLQLFDVDFSPYASVPEALKALEEKEVEVVVYDRPILKYYLNQEDYEDIILTSKNLKTDYYSFSFPKGSPLREFLDPYVVKTLKSPEWSFKLKNINEEEM